MNKSFLYKLALLVLLLVTSCFEVDFDEKKYEHKFIEQVAQGEISKKPWVFEVGTYSESITDSKKVSIGLYAEQLTEPCVIKYSYKNNKVRFRLPKAVGLYKLNPAGSDSFTVTFYVESEDLNKMASEGAVEILSINEETKEITGRMDVIFGDDKINGNFKVSYCNSPF